MTSSQFAVKKTTSSSSSSIVIDQETVWTDPVYDLTTQGGGVTVLSNVTLTIRGTVLILFANDTAISLQSHARLMIQGGDDDDDHDDNSHGWVEFRGTVPDIDSSEDDSSSAHCGKGIQAATTTRTTTTQDDPVYISIHRLLCTNMTSCVTVLGGVRTTTTSRNDDDANAPNVTTVNISHSRFTYNVQAIDVVMGVWGPPHQLWLADSQWEWNRDGVRIASKGTNLASKGTRSRLNIQRCTFDHTLRTAVMASSAAVTVVLQEVQFRNNGFALSARNVLQARNCTFSQNVDGLELKGKSLAMGYPGVTKRESWIQDCIFVDNRKYGLLYTGDGGLTLAHSLFLRNGMGAFFHRGIFFSNNNNYDAGADDHSIILDSCVFVGHNVEETQAAAVRFDDAGVLNMTSSVFWANGRGVAGLGPQDSTRVNVTNSTFVQNDIGIYLPGDFQYLIGLDLVQNNIGIRALSEYDQNFSGVLKGCNFISSTQYHLELMDLSGDMNATHNYWGSNSSGSSSGTTTPTNVTEDMIRTKIKDGYKNTSCLPIGHVILEPMATTPFVHAPPLIDWESTTAGTSTVPIFLGVPLCRHLSSPNCPGNDNDDEQDWASPTPSPIRYDDDDAVVSPFWTHTIMPTRSPPMTPPIPTRPSSATTPTTPSYDKSDTKNSPSPLPTLTELRDDENTKATTRWVTPEDAFAVSVLLSLVLIGMLLHQRYYQSSSLSSPIVFRGMHQEIPQDDNEEEENFPAKQYRDTTTATVDGSVVATTTRSNDQHGDYDSEVELTVVQKQQERESPTHPAERTTSRGLMIV